ncbi:hypothetical protein ABFB09_00170 [Dehalogenimonas sp. THU2]|uniref:hypothetical protein n=1 Tax=Dehalogenimonas sp. THU2 TaxID=3151121 RepID=UPI0032189E53
MAFCTSCGHTTGPEDEFCANCGKTAGHTAKSPVESPPAPSETSATIPTLPGATTPPNKKTGIGMPVIVLSAILGLAVIFGGVSAAQWQSASGQVDDLTVQKDEVTAERDDLSLQIQNLSSQITTLSASVSALEADKSRLSDDLAKIQSKFPLKNFGTEFELQNWLLAAIKKLNPLDDYPEQYYMLQRLAMDDGYFLSVAIWEDEQFYYPELYAVAGDMVYICFEDGSIYPSFQL